MRFLKIDSSFVKWFYFGMHIKRWLLLLLIGVAIMALGFAYFCFITSLSTVLQEQLDDHERGRVMALWIMGFGGTVPIGNLLAGPLIDATSVTTVVLTGAVVAVALAAYADLTRS